MTNDHKPLTKEQRKPVLHTKWISPVRGEWWRVAGNPISFAGNPPRRSSPYESKYIQMLYADDVRSAVEGLRIEFDRDGYENRAIDKWFPAFKDAANDNYTNGEEK